MYLTAGKFLVAPFRRSSSKNLAPVPRFQGTPARLLSIQTVGRQSEEDSGLRNLVSLPRKKLERASTDDYSEGNGASRFVMIIIHGKMLLNSNLEQERI